MIADLTDLAVGNWLLPPVFVRFARRGGGPGPMLISSFQKWFVSKGTGCSYTPGCSNRSLRRAILSFFASFRRFL
jgi:hypothetical protein